MRQSRLGFGLGFRVTDSARVKVRVSVRFKVTDSASVRAFLLLDGSAVGWDAGARVGVRVRVRVTDSAKVKGRVRVKVTDSARVRVRASLLLYASAVGRDAAVRVRVRGEGGRPSGLGFRSRIALGLGFARGLVSRIVLGLGSRIVLGLGSVHETRALLLFDASAVGVRAGVRDEGVRVRVRITVRG